MEPGIGKKGIVPKLFLGYQKSVIIILLIVFWELLSRISPSIYISSIPEIVQEFGKLGASGELGKHIGTSLKISVIGLLIGQVLAIPIGALLGWYEKAYNYLDPLLTLMRNTSILAILPLFVLFLGIGDVSKIAIIIWATFFPTMLNTMQGVRHTDATLIRSAQSMGVGNIGLFAKVVLPSASPYITAGFRQAAGIALLVIVGAEMLGARYGIGYMIFQAQKSYLIPKMYVGIITMAVLGIVVNGLCSKLERELIKWQEKSHLE
ncbi:MAG: ABC transporter permease [Clostridiales Family XIII bacterium]|jgi:NitT/TauT family transport system permease protein|nr:ABC transporter permease [Clostridiales Family XIII bacterium]